MWKYSVVDATALKEGDGLDCQLVLAPQSQQSYSNKSIGTVATGLLRFGVHRAWSKILHV